MFAWICEHIHDSHDLYITLHEHFGMSLEEIHDHCIDSLDEFFPESAVTRLREKIQRCFDEYKAEWLQKRPDILIEEAEEIASVQRMMKELPDAVMEKDAEYLLRFKNPLEVVSDYWQSMNGSGTVVDDDMAHILWEIRDRGMQSRTTRWSLSSMLHTTLPQPQMSM